MTMLAVFCGLPGTGKTTLARELALATGGMHLRIDAIENGIRASALAPEDLMDAAYHAAWALTEENLSLGLSVIGDAVNPIPQCRIGWRAVAHRTGVRLCEIEVVCSDRDEHRRRVEERRERTGGGPGWAEVEARYFVPPTGARTIIDTATLSPDAALERLVEATLG